MIRVGSGEVHGREAVVAWAAVAGTVPRPCRNQNEDAIVDIKLVDVTVHIDPDLDSAGRATVENTVRALDGVVSVHMPDDRPHLVVVEYNPDKVNSKGILDAILGQGMHAELAGL
jgi:hypothetical protein